MVERHYFAGDIVRNRVSNEEGEIVIANTPEKMAFVRVTGGDAPGTYKWPYDQIEMVHSIESRGTINEHNPDPNVSTDAETVDEKHFAEHTMDVKQALVDTVKRIEKELVDRMIMDTDVTITTTVWCVEDNEYELSFSITDGEDCYVSANDPEEAIKEFIRRKKWDDEHNPELD